MAKKKVSEKITNKDMIIGIIIVILVLWIAFKIIGGVFGFIGHAFGTIFGEYEWVERYSEQYVGSYSIGVKENDIKCRVISSGDSKYLLKCKLKSEDLKDSWESSTIYTGLIDYQTEQGYCYPNKEKDKVKECLDKK